MAYHHAVFTVQIGAVSFEMSQLLTSSICAPLLHNRLAKPSCGHDEFAASNSTNIAAAANEGELRPKLFVDKHRWEELLLPKLRRVM